MVKLSENINRAITDAMYFYSITLDPQILKAARIIDNTDLFDLDKIGEQFTAARRALQKKSFSKDEFAKMLQKAGEDLQERGGFEQLDESLESQMELQRTRSGKTPIPIHKRAGVNSELCEFAGYAINALRLVLLIDLLQKRESDQQQRHYMNILKNRMYLAVFQELFHSEYGLANQEQSGRPNPYNETMKGKAEKVGVYPPEKRKRIMKDEISDKERAFDFLGTIMGQVINSFRENEAYRNCGIPTFNNTIRNI